MNQMMLTYIITAISGAFAAGSIVYFTKNKRFIGRSSFTTIASIIVFIMGIYSIMKGIPLNQLQYLIESSFQ